MSTSLSAWCGKYSASFIVIENFIRDITKELLRSYTLQELEDALGETGEAGEIGYTWETGGKGDTGLTGSTVL